MSECMTIADVFPAEEKYPDGEPTAKDIAQSILTEALHSVVVNADKDSNHIGDHKVGEEFLPEFARFPVNCSASEGVRESCEEDKIEKEYRVIKEQALADSELRFENGKIRIQANGAKAVVNLSREQTNPAAKEVNKSQSCVKGGSDKKVESSSKNVLVVKSGQEKAEECWKEGESTDKGGEGCGERERPFTPFTTEDLRKSILQVWKNVNSSMLNGLDGEMVNQPQEVVRLMEDLATIRVTADPSRPRACTVVEDDMIKEMEDMNFKASHQSSENVAVAQIKGNATEEDNPAGLLPSGSESEIFSEAKNEIALVSLTESNEAFIESLESVIQIIEPQDDSNDENEEGNAISFSLLNETPKDGEMPADDYHQCDDSEDRHVEGIFSRCLSGMTTVGPIKIPKHDPKTLTNPEVDYGKMTRISGSRELRKDSSEERKIFLEDGEDSSVIFFENGYLEFDTIVNHDIASLTKMQKVKEVLSDQPKSEEDLRREEKLMRSPLDLKDVDADSCDSYDVIDVGIPLLTMEETSRNSQTKVMAHENSEEKEVEDERTTAKSDSANEEPPVHTPSSFSYNKSSTQLNTGQALKHNTISRVFQKASNRFVMKDSDSFLRNSRSLPRDTSKIANTESFRSLLDDCQTSAATVLKKSRSLLKNTQNALKAVSKTGFGHAVSGDKQDYAAPDIASDTSGSSKKKEFLKFKDTIKSKVGKTLKNFEHMKTGSTERYGSELCENQKKLSPKSPLVCANQLSINRTMEGEDSPSLLQDRHGESFDGREAFEGEDHGMEGPDKEIEVICSVKFQGGRRFTQDDSNDITSDVDYVVMETIRHGIEPLTAEEEDDLLASPKSATGAATETGKLADAKKSLILPVDTAQHLEEYIGSEDLTNGKLRRKNKKLSARIRSFWQTAFGKVKATSNKKNLS